MSSAMSDPLLEDGDTDTVDVGMANLLRRKKGSVNKNYLPEQKLAAAQLLYTLVEPSSHALSFSELQSIFLQVSKQQHSGEILPLSRQPHLCLRRRKTTKRLCR